MVLEWRGEKMDLRRARAGGASVGVCYGAVGM